MASKLPRPCTLRDVVRIAAAAERDAYLEAERQGLDEDECIRRGIDASEAVWDEYGGVR